MNVIVMKIKIIDEYKNESKTIGRTNLKTIGK